MPETAAAGLTVGIGRATVVVLRGSRRDPAIVVRYEIQLADPWVPESMHPYHHELGDTGSAGRRARQRGCAAALAASRRAMRTLVSEMRSHGLWPCGAAIVVRSLLPPSRFPGAHARAHAEERKLYREAVESALARCGLRVATFSGEKFRAAAGHSLGRSAAEVDATLKAFSHHVGTPWREPEKHAALAAWLTLPAAGARGGRARRR